MQSQPNQQIPAENAIDTSKMTTVCKIENGFFHKFATQKVRELVDITICQILQYISLEGTQVPTYYLRIGSHVQSLELCTFVKAQFQNLVTFVFQNSQDQYAIYLLSFEIYNPSLQSFCQAIKDATQVIDYKSDSYEKTNLKNKINLVCNGELTEDMIEDVEYVGPILKTVGGVLGAVSKNVLDPTAKAETIMVNGINFLSNKISQENKQRWGLVKETASTFNDKMTEIYKPIDTAFKLLTSTISQNFNKSDNKYIKTLKKFSLATAATLNSSYKKAEQHTVVNVAQKENQSEFHEVHELSTQNFS